MKEKQTEEEIEQLANKQIPYSGDVNQAEITQIKRVFYAKGYTQCQEYATLKLQEQAKEIEYQQQVMKEEIERLKSLLKECKVLIHQEMFMDDDYDGVWRDEPETIVKNINKLLTNKKI
jgi:hypothetical protein